MNDCVGSGFCCKKAPCPYGEVTSETNSSCRFLEQLETKGHPRYTCGKAEEIIKDPTSIISPAFNSGCCMPLFNEDRNQILYEINSEQTSLDLHRKV